MKLAWSFHGLSMNFQWSPRSFTIPDWSFSGLRGLHILQNFLKRFKTVFQRSFRKMVFQWSFSSLSAVSQWTFKGLISLSMIFRQSLNFFSFRVLSGVLVSCSEFFQWSRSVFQRSWLIFQRSLAVCQMIFQWSLNSLIGLSVNFQLSSRSYGDLAGKVVFGLSKVFQGFSEPFHRDSKFHWSWRLLKDLANFRSFSGFSRVSVLWNGGLANLR